MQILKSVLDKLLNKQSELQKCKDFESIHEIVSDSKINGFGVLCVYDTSLRIASYLNIKPDRIYLHAGTLEGAKALGLKTKGERYLTVDELPREFKNIDCDYIEDILCIYKDKLTKVYGKQ